MNTVQSLTTQRHTVSSSLRTAQLNEACNSSPILLLCVIIAVKFGRIIILHAMGASHLWWSLSQLHQLKWNVMHIKLRNHIQLYSLSQKKKIQICVTLAQTCFRIHTFRQIHLKLGEHIRMSYSTGTLRKNKERMREKYERFILRKWQTVFLTKVY